MVAINERIYYYRKNDSGIMRSSFAKRRFDILSFQNEIETYLGEDSTFFRKEIDYAEMRIAVRVLNDCIIAGKESEFSKEMGRVRNILRIYHPDRTVCELKYLLIVFMVKNNYCLYKNLVKSWR